MRMKFACESTSIVLRCFLLSPAGSPLGKLAADKAKGMFKAMHEGDRIRIGSYGFLAFSVLGLL